MSKVKSVDVSSTSQNISAWEKGINRDLILLSKSCHACHFDFIRILRLSSLEIELLGLYSEKGSLGGDSRLHE